MLGFFIAFFGGAAMSWMWRRPGRRKQDAGDSLKWVVAALVLQLAAALPIVFATRGRDEDVMIVAAMPVVMLFGVGIVALEVSLGWFGPPPAKPPARQDPWDPKPPSEDE